MILKMFRLPIFPILVFQIFLFSLLIRTAADSNLPSSIDSSAIVGSDKEAKTLIEEAQVDVNERWKMYEQLASSGNGKADTPAEKKE